MAFETLDLGKVISTAEAIKGARDQSVVRQLQMKYMPEQMEREAQAGRIAKSQEERAAAQEARTAATFSEEQQLNNTKLLHAAAAEIMQNPAAVERWLPQLRTAGVFPPGDDNAWRSVPPEQIQARAKEFFESTRAALEAFDPQRTEGATQRAATAAEKEKDRQNALEVARLKASADAAKASHLRPIPPAIYKGIIENRGQLDKIDRAIAALKGPDANPDAFGAQNYLPDAVVQRLPGKGQSGGVDARAKVADIGSMVIHDRSGASATAGELPRLQPFVPVATDAAPVVLTKLENLRANIAAMQEETESAYSEAAGYRSPPQPPPPPRGGNGASGRWSIEEVQ